MTKRLLDILFSFLGLLALSPVLLPVMYLVWKQDYHSPFYVAPRVGLNGQLFKMIKLRSMVINADKTGVDSTSANDRRITPVGHFIRRYKLDEFTQLINVFTGQMSLVGPRPNVTRDVSLYTDTEKSLLSVKPGITDFSSIVFSDEGDILKDKADPDLSYNQLIRPWKSRLGLFYIAHASTVLDFKLIFLTVVAIFSRPAALAGIEKILRALQADAELVSVARRVNPLVPFPPPGASEIVTSRAMAS